MQNTQRVPLVILSYEHVVHAIVKLFLGLHDLLDQLQRCAQWQTNDIVIRSLDALNQYCATTLYPVPAGFVIPVARPYVCEQKLIGD